MYNQDKVNVCKTRNNKQSGLNIFVDCFLFFVLYCVLKVTRKGVYSNMHYVYNSTDISVHVTALYNGIPNTLTV